MNDRFKFRAWKKEDKKMCECESIHPYTNEHTQGGETFLKEDVYRRKYSYYFPEEVELMQCTGLKDKNGKLIYEGDIVKIFHVSSTMQGREYKRIVIYNSDKARYELENYGVFYEDDIYEVIGNIYENKDLLEE